MAELYGDTRLVAGDHRIDMTEGPLRICRGERCWYVGEKRFLDSEPESDPDYIKAAFAPELGLVALQYRQDERGRASVDVFDLERRVRIAVVPTTGELMGLLGTSLSLWLPGEPYRCAGSGVSGTPGEASATNGVGTRFCSTWALHDARTGRWVGSIASNLMSTYPLPRAVVPGKGLFVTLLDGRLEERELKTGKRRRSLELATLLPHPADVEANELQEWFDYNVVLVTDPAGVVRLASSDGRIFVLDAKTLSVTRVITPPACAPSSAM